jgi:hypothetical protein
MAERPHRCKVTHLYYTGFSRFCKKYFLSTGIIIRLYLYWYYMAKEEKFHRKEKKKPKKVK